MKKIKVELLLDPPKSELGEGPDMDILYITTAKKKRDPLGGSLFVAHLNIKGPRANFYTK